MISYIHGVVVFKNLGSASILANGVGYEINTGNRFTEKLPIGATVGLFVETIVKEDSITLYGFSSYEKKVWFNSLLKVSGVGAKSALSIIDTFEVQEIINAIIGNQFKVFQSISGLGEKISQRIVADLQKEPAKNIKYISSAVILKNISTETIQVQNVDTIEDVALQEKNHSVNINDVVSGLCNLGFDFNRSFAVANEVCKNATTLEDAITQALKSI